MHFSLGVMHGYLFFFFSLLVYGNFSSGPCDPGWIDYGDICYFFSSLDSRANHSAALAFCRAKGGVLVSPNTAEKQEFLVKYLLRYHPSYGTPIWIGLYQNTSSDPFRWEDGSPLNYTNWGCGEPNNAGSGEDCALIGISSNIFLSSTWNDDSCSKHFAYICQMPGKLWTFQPFFVDLSLPLFNSPPPFLSITASFWNDCRVTSIVQLRTGITGANAHVYGDLLQLQLDFRHLYRGIFTYWKIPKRTPPPPKKKRPAIAACTCRRAW